jgi:hypothetical protein
MIITDQHKVIVPLDKKELQTFFDATSLKVINYFLKKSMVSQPESFKGQSNMPIHIPKEHIEQWVCQAIQKAEPVGAGSYPIDVVAKPYWGADIKMLSCKIDKKTNKLKNADSGETSLAQKFGDDNFGDGNTLDDLFTKLDYTTIWESWKEILLEKYKVVEKDFGVNNIYFFFVLRANLNFHLCGMKVNLNNLSNTEINYDRSTKSSMWVKNYIHDNFGHVKVYKSKKRLELRLKPKYWVENNLVITFKTEFKAEKENIRQLIEKDELQSYIDKKMKPILNINKI